MAAKAQNFEIFQGDDKQLIITVRDESGNILPLTGYAAVWVAYQQTTLANVITKSTSGGGISIPDPDSGQIIVELEPNDTVNITPKVYNHQCEVEDASGKHTTITAGYMTVVRNVTNFN